MRGYQDAQGSRGVGATVKHWPGFGDSEINSDNGIAKSPQTLAQVEQTNIPPFRAALQAGVDRVMVTHILYTKVTGSRVPTSLSRFWVDGFLRGHLGYQGPVVTDALDAAALNEFTPSQVALSALRAGDDELLEIAQTPTDKPPADLLAAYPAVLRAVRSGKISKARLDLSVSRILNRSSPHAPEETRVRTDGPARSASNAAGRRNGPDHTASRLNSGSRLNSVVAGTGRPRSSA